MSTQKYSKKEIEALSYRDVQQLCKTIGCKAVGKKEELMERCIAICCKEEIVKKDQEIEQLSTKIASIKLEDSIGSKDKKELKDAKSNDKSKKSTSSTTLSTAENTPTLFDYMPSLDRYKYKYVEPSDILIEDNEYDVVYDLGYELSKDILKKRKTTDFQPIIEKFQQHNPLHKNKKKSEDRYILFSRGIITLFTEYLENEKEQKPEEVIESLLEGGRESKKRKTCY